MKKDLRFVCYTYMHEKSCKVDYEVLSDALAVSIGMVLPHLTEKERVVTEDLEHIQLLSYHANGSVRGRLAIEEKDIEWLSERYDFYCAEVGDKMKQFVLPRGPVATMLLHQVRNDAKLVYRALHHANKEEPVSKLLFQFTGLLSNVAGAMAMYVNQLNGVSEVPFETKSYTLR